MINLTLNDIRKTTNELSFRRGVMYYQNGLVSNLQHNGGEIIANVSGSEDYEVRVYFDGNSGNLINMNCNCPAYGKYPGSCKHIVATLLEILYSKEKLNISFDRLSNEKIINAFSKSLVYETETEQAHKVPIQLEIIIEPKYENHTDINLKIGTDKLYVIKNFIEFFQAVKNNNTVTFGKYFTLDPKSQSFNEYDKKIIDMLIDYNDMYSGMNNYHYNLTRMYNGNILQLPYGLLKKFLGTLNGGNFTLKYSGIPTTSHIFKGPLMMEFTVWQEHSNIMVKLKETHKFFSITPDYEYVFFDDAIYHLTNKERRLFKVIKEQFNTHNRTLILSSDYKSSFFSTVLPVLKSFGTVKMDEEIQKDIINVDLDAEIRLDRYKNTVKGTLSYKYGDYTIGIYPPLEPALPDGYTILRNAEKESHIISTIKAAGFVVDSSLEWIFLPDEERLYDFIETYLPKLQTLANIYYSEDFKSLQIKIPQNVNSGIRLNETSQMLEFSFDIDNIDKKELPQIFKSIQEKKKYYRLKDGSFLQLGNKELIDVADIINKLNIKTKDFSKDFVEISKYRALYVDSLLDEKNITSFSRQDSFSKLVHDIKSPDEVNHTIPKSLEMVLRNYQKQGFKWMKTLSDYSFGGILADDMGLGKTLQAITLLKSIDASKQSLVVAPTSLIYNWEDEIKKFAPDLKVCVISGNKSTREKIIETITDYQVIVTSYGLLKRDIEEYGDFQFEYCFIDEAQHIKNPNSQNAKSVKLINAATRFALTGTPIENSLTELWSIFDFIMPGYLYSHNKFVNYFEKPIIKEQDSHAIDNLTKHINPFLLRRLKTDVLKELPPKIETKMTTELHEEQKKLYLAYLEKAKSDVTNEIATKGYSKSSITILAVLTRLRQICCHPALFVENYKENSAKLELLEEIVVDAIESGHRILIFSQFTAMLELINKMLSQNKITHFYLDGSTPAEDRRDMVNSFNKGENNVFLISLKAGGTGLNLTGADMVIHYDPWWNPAAEDQATDRAYRIGQDKPVQVIKLITSGTIEEKIFKLQQKKKSLIDSVIKPGETFISQLSEEEILGLLEP